MLEAQPIHFEVDPDSSNIGRTTNFIQNNWKEFSSSDFSLNREPLEDHTFQGRVDRSFNGIWNECHQEKLLNMKYVDVNFIDGKLYSLNYTVTNPHILPIASSESEILGHAT